MTPPLESTMKTKFVSPPRPNLSLPPFHYQSTIELHQGQPFLYTIELHRRVRRKADPRRLSDYHHSRAAHSLPMRQELVKATEMGPKE